MPTAHFLKTSLDASLGLLLEVICIPLGNCRPSNLPPFPSLWNSIIIGFFSFRLERPSAFNGFPLRFKHKNCFQFWVVSVARLHLKPC